MGVRAQKARRMKRLITEWESSGESAGRFAKRASVGVSTLWDWKRRLSESRALAPAPSLVPLQVLGEAREVDRFELVLTDGRRLLIPAAVTSESLERVLRVVSSC